MKRNKQHQSDDYKGVGYLLHFALEQFINKDLNIEGAKAKKLVNKITKTTKFGNYDDEIYYGTVENVKFLFFAGTYAKYDMETVQEIRFLQQKNNLYIQKWHHETISVKDVEYLQT